MEPLFFTKNITDGPFTIFIWPKTTTQFQLFLMGSLIYMYSPKIFYANSLE